MIKISKSWFEILKDEFNSDNYKNLEKFLGKEYNSYTIYPSAEHIFNAINFVPYNSVKVVIIGQDPYHEPNQAMGLSFSVPKSADIPPSLQNIYKELNSDLGCYIPKHGDLTSWARQGVLLLNSVLTVRRGQANSHKNKGWEQITSKIIEKLNEREQPIVFMLWGRNAQEIGANINKNKHLVLTAPHPSPLSAYSGFFGCRHFSKANKFLEEHNIEPIDWQIKD
ncbi:MAG: uracil-DNA glycosylase [Clostridia bacterium]|nr:uracil-DNA glycosylase [Clostridia bacterium]